MEACLDSGTMEQYSVQSSAGEAAAHTPVVQPHEHDGVVTPHLHHLADLQPSQKGGDSDTENPHLQQTCLLQTPHNSVLPSGGAESPAQKPTEQPMQHRGTGVWTEACEAWMMPPTKDEPSDADCGLGSTDSPVMLTDSDVVFLWRTVREGKELVTDADTARFLLSL